MPSESRALEHLKHGVEHGQHDHVALHQPASVQGRSLRISDYLSCRALLGKVKTFVSGDFCSYKFRCVHCRPVSWRAGGAKGQFDQTQGSKYPGAAAGGSGQPSPSQAL